MRNFFDNPLLLLVLILLIVLIFGAKRLPDMTRNVARSMRIFKSEVQEMKRDDDRPHPPSRPVEGRVVGSDDHGHGADEGDGDGHGYRDDRSGAHPAAGGTQADDDPRQPHDAQRSSTERPHDG